MNMVNGSRQLASGAMTATKHVANTIFVLTSLWLAKRLVCGGNGEDLEYLDFDPSRGSLPDDIAAWYNDT